MPPLTFPRMMELSDALEKAVDAAVYSNAEQMAEILTGATRNRGEQRYLVLLTCSTYLQVMQEAEREAGRPPMQVFGPGPGTDRSAAHTETATAIAAIMGALNAGDHAGVAAVLAQENTELHLADIIVSAVWSIGHLIRDH